MTGRPRYFADKFDADGKFYVFDEQDQCSECAGPFDTIEQARAKAHEMNSAGAEQMMSRLVTVDPTIEAQVEKQVDLAVQRKLSTDSRYRDAETPEAQAEIEQEITDATYEAIVDGHYRRRFPNGQEA